jgi:flagellin
MNTIRQTQAVGNRQNQAQQRLASGQRINRAADDAAGLAISERIHNLIRGLDQAFRNSADGVSMVQVAEGALGSVNDMLGRARELTVQAANDTLTSQQRSIIQAEVSQILQEVDTVARNTNFNTQTLLDGDPNHQFGLQTGANAGQRLDVLINSMNLNGLELDNYAGLFEVAAASSIPLGGRALSGMLDNIDRAANFVTEQRANLGAVQNRLEHTMNNLQTASINQSAANSRIRDTDMARESMNLAVANILQNASIAMQVHNNANAGAMLQLLRR